MSLPPSSRQLAQDCAHQAGLAASGLTQEYEHGFLSIQVAAHELVYGLAELWIGLVMQHLGGDFLERSAGKGASARETPVENEHFLADAPVADDAKDVFADLLSPCG